MRPEDDVTHLPAERRVAHIKSAKQIRIICADCMKITTPLWEASEPLIDGLVIHIRCHGVERLAVLHYREFICWRDDGRPIDVLWNDLVDAHAHEKIADHEQHLVDSIARLQKLKEPSDTQKLLYKGLEEALVVVRSVRKNLRERGLVTV